MSHDYHEWEDEDWVEHEDEESMMMAFLAHLEDHSFMCAWCNSLTYPVIEEVNAEEEFISFRSRPTSITLFPFDKRVRVLSLCTDCERKWKGGGLN